VKTRVEDKKKRPRLTVGALLLAVIQFSGCIAATPNPAADFFPLTPRWMTGSPSSGGSVKVRTFQSFQ